MNKPLRMLCFAILLIVIAFPLNEILEDKTSQNTLGTYKKTDADVIFVGNSHVSADVYPLEIYEKYGIRSYDMAIGAIHQKGKYYMIRRAIAEHKPKVVFLETYPMGETDQTNYNAIYHTLFDDWGLSYDKLSAVASLFLNDWKLNGKSEMNYLELLCSIPAYHTRWSSFHSLLLECRESTEVGMTYDMNAWFQASMGDTETFNFDIVSEELPDDYNENMYWVEKTIEFCQKEGIEIVLFNSPKTSTEETQKYYNYLYVLADKYQIEYLDLNRMDGLIDYTSDIGVSQSREERLESAIESTTYEEGVIYEDIVHLNCSGAYKESDYLAKYILDHYENVLTEDDAADQYYRQAYEGWDSGIDAYFATAQTISEYLAAGSRSTYEVDMDTSTLRAAGCALVTVTRVDSGQVVDQAIFDVEGNRVRVD